MSAPQAPGHSAYSRASGTTHREGASMSAPQAPGRTPQLRCAVPGAETPPPALLPSVPPARPREAPAREAKQ